MYAYWDTSAVIAQIFLEEGSNFATRAAEHASVNFSWRWLRVEASAALTRRNATENQWARLRSMLANFAYLDIGEGDLDDLIAQNHKWKLRSADAGHLFCFEKSLLIYPGAILVTLDAELRAAAKKQNYAIF